MPSSDAHSSSAGSSGTRRLRVQRACNVCRRRKRRCDGQERCDLCAKHNFKCTYVEPALPLELNGSVAELYEALQGPPIPGSVDYVGMLKVQIRVAEVLLEKQKAALKEGGPGVQVILNVIHQLDSLTTHTPLPDDLTFDEITTSFQSMSITDRTWEPGFCGKSSRAALAKYALNLARSGQVSSPQPVAPWQSGRKSRTIKSVASKSVPSVTIPRPTYTFPDDDLLRSLVSLYFINVNRFLPLLHNPTFEESLTQNLHKTHRSFAKTLLLVCAVGARYDDRVLPNAGWKWFNQVNVWEHSIERFPTLYDVQAFCLAAEFLDATSGPRTSWQFVGFGIRIAEDLALHRFRVCRGAMAFEQELEKRAWWVLMVFDAQISATLGRVTALEAVDFNQHPPILCDDEYWGNPDTTLFMQPAGKPSIAAFFNHLIELNRILALSCKILYSTKPRRLALGLEDDGWQEKVVRELDSALNTWFETIPDHLHWKLDSPIQDDTFFDQSAVLQCTYYYTRIMIHRPFIPVIRGILDPTHLPSLAICTTAARACINVAEMQQQRRPNTPLRFGQTPLFTSAVVLLLNLWGGSGTAVAKTKDLHDIHRCITMLSAWRSQWPSVDALIDALQRLVALDQRPPDHQLGP
ncbi:fungal-specific transcription factor domain-containing protein [Mycena maculata]|uniref:Fungal-specific transcription factor domain-containing protein n=1 Tax=Mycena maculata TaxID=230809 RepID=A0AAD7MT72_9AGAR|nr:fungal-specific transcription factor domain-containing protein [Mycena maculata]